MYNDEPVIDLQAITYPSMTYRMDFANRRIRGTVDGLEAIMQAAVKILMTERGVCDLYGTDYGIERADLIGEPRDYAAAVLPERINDALSADDRIRGISNFEILPDPRKNVLVCRYDVEAAPAGSFPLQSEVYI